MNSPARRLEGRTALVTGAGGTGTGGIGRGVAIALAAEGANVVIATRRQETGEATAAFVARENGRALAVRCDVSVRKDVEGAVSAGISEFGRLDIVIHNAVNHTKGERPLALDEITDADWDEQASVAWDGAYFLAQAAFPYLKVSAAGRFIVFGSASGLRGASMNPVFSALKGGCRGFVKALAREWAPYGITVNAINPMASSDPDTLFARLEGALGTDVRAVEEIKRNLPMGRLGRPREDIGRAIAAICSDDFCFVTAQSIQIDGGVYTAL